MKILNNIEINILELMILDKINHFLLEKDEICDEIHSDDISSLMCLFTKLETLKKEL